jgi:low temperature requirement protein LtrA
MSALRRNFRNWWQPPKRIADREAERSVTFLELFYDLVYVVIVAELAHALAGDVSWAGLGRFAFLFVIVWWAWINGSIYHDLHGNNDIRTRVFTFLQMGSVAAMAVFAYDAMGESSTGFALSYAAFQLILLVLWWRTGVHDPDHRPLSQPYAVVFSITTLLFVGSVFVMAPLRFYLWGIAVFASLQMPLYMSSLGRNNPAIQAQIDLSMVVSPSLVERFGLLTIIVLGEVIAGTIRGLAEHPQLNWEAGITAVLGMGIAIGIWWFYFDAISHHSPRPGQNMTLTWMSLHLPLTIGIVAVGAAVLNVVENAGEALPVSVRWLLVGACALVLVIIPLLMETIRIPNEHQPLYRRGRRAGLAAAVFIALLGFTNLGTIPLLIGVSLLLLAPVFYSLLAWIELVGEAA